MTESDKVTTELTTGPFGNWLLAVSGLALVLAVAWPAVVDLGDKWISNEAYSHGFVLLAVSVFLGVKKLPELPESAVPSPWFLPALLLSLLFVLIARLSELHVVAQYGLVGTVGAMVLGFWGWRGVVVLLIPLVLLLLAVPMPGYFEVNLTAELKLVSSQLGAMLLQSIGVPVYNEGNIIDLGSYRLQVADACSGLNYMIPLVAIGVMTAGFLQTTVWRRVAVVLLTIPLTVLMNIFRIAIAGLLVKYVGPGTAEGFIHDFEGWMVFVASLVALLPMAALVLRLGPGPTTLSQAFVVDLTLPSLAVTQWTPLARRNLIVSVVSLLAVLCLVLALQGRNKVVPERMGFETFPKLIGEWVGTPGTLDSGSLEMLRLTDYIWSTFSAPSYSQPVSLLSTWYAVQTDGATPHSPNICLPGAGWEIVSLDRTTVSLRNGVDVPVNRALMERQGDRMLAYYWFQQRGHLFANEFIMKWFIIQDSITMNRADGGMVRLTTLLDGSDVEGDQRLQDFMSEIWPILPRYLPD